MDATITTGPDRDRGPYRRRQRRRAIIAWSTLVLVAAVVAAGIAFGGDDETESQTLVHLFSWEMSSAQYEQLHKGEGELAVIKKIGTTGLREDEVEEPDLLRMFPPPPRASSCSFWKLSDAPDHLVRLCFSNAGGVLLEKAVRAPGEGGAETTLA